MSYDTTDHNHRLLWRRISFRAPLISGDLTVDSTPFFNANNTRTPITDPFSGDNQSSPFENVLGTFAPLHISLTHRVLKCIKLYYGVNKYVAWNVQSIAVLEINIRW